MGVSTERWTLLALAAFDWLLIALHLRRFGFIQSQYNLHSYKHLCVEFENITSDVEGGRALARTRLQPGRVALVLLSTSTIVYLSPALTHLPSRITSFAPVCTRIRSLTGTYCGSTLDCPVVVNRILNPGVVF